MRDTGTLTGRKGVGEGHRYTYRREGGLVRDTGTLTGGKGVGEGHRYTYRREGGW